MHSSVSLDNRLANLRTAIQRETSRLAALVMEAENENPLPHLVEATCFSAAICLDVRADLDKLRAQLREVEVGLDSGVSAKSGRSLPRERSARLLAATAAAEWRLHMVSETLNKARLTMDGVIDIWGNRLPSGGLWDK